MAKRPRPKEAVTDTTPESGEVNVVRGNERLPEGNIGELKEELDNPREPTPSGQVNGLEQGATADMAGIEELDDGSFWALLLRAGYTIW